MNQRKSPGGETGASPQQGAFQGARNIMHESAAGCSLAFCPFPMDSEIFPERTRAMMCAKTRAELVQASARFAFAAMWRRRVVGRGMDIAHVAVAGEILARCRLSTVRPRMPARCADEIVRFADEVAKAVAG